MNRCDAKKDMEEAGGGKIRGGDRLTNNTWRRHVEQHLHR